PDKESLVVECQRNTGKRSLCQRTASEELNALEDLPESAARSRVAECLSHTRFLVYVQVADDHDHKEVAGFAALLDYFADHCAALIDIEDEGFYSRIDTPLLGGGCVKRSGTPAPKGTKKRQTDSPPAGSAPQGKPDKHAIAEVLATLEQHRVG